MDPITGVLVFVAIVVGFFVLRNREETQQGSDAASKPPAASPPPTTSPTPTAANPANPQVVEPLATAPAVVEPSSAPKPVTKSVTPARSVASSAVSSPDRERQERLAAVAALGKFATERATLDRDGLQALQALGSLTLDLDASVRAAAVAALGRIPSAEAIPYLERALRDSDLAVVAAASEAISRYKFYPVAPDDEAEVLLPLNAAAMAEEMVAIDALETLETLVAARKPSQSVVSNGLAQGSGVAVEDPESQERLETIAALQALTGDRPVDTQTLEAVELLGEFSLDLDATVRAAAVTAIGTIPSATAIPYLERALQDSDSDVAIAASEAIARYKFYPPEIESVRPLPPNAAPTD